MSEVFSEYEMRKLPPRERLDKLVRIFTNHPDQSVRWDCVWLTGEICTLLNNDHPMRKEIANLFVWILNNDDDSIVRHEAAFQIGLRNMMDKLPDLMHSILNDKSDLVKHEAIEAVGLLRAQEVRENLREMFDDPSEAVRDTAKFVVKRLERLEGQGVYQGEEII